MNEIVANPYFFRTIISISLIIVFVIGKYFYLRKYKEKDKYLLKKNISQSLNTILTLIILFIWVYQFKEALYSLVAVAAAIVIATKELIMCFTGGILVKITKAFGVGDRIEIDEVRGFVVESGFLSTKILEIGPEANSQQTTGDVISIPNSIFLTETLTNESYFNGYSIQLFKFYISDKEKLQNLEDAILNYSNEICSEYIDKAKSHITKFCRKEGINIPSIEPRVKIQLADEKLYLLLKMPVRVDSIADIEQKLLRKFLLLDSK